MSGPESASEGLFAPLPQQLDLEGKLHDLAPQSEPMRLFEHEPQLAGQAWLELEGDD